MRQWSFILFLAAPVFLPGCGEQTDPVEKTRADMTLTFVRLNIYANATKMVPTNLDVLADRDPKTNPTIDGWNRPFHYQISEDGVVSLTSYGADGKPGGEGINADISMSYHSTREDGTLWAGSPLWIAEAKVR